MTGKNPRVCPACHKPARNRPLPPEGFWQVQILQRIGMYPYRCEACEVRFYRKVPIGLGLGPGRFSTSRHRPMPKRDSGAAPRPRGKRSAAGAEGSSRPPGPKDHIPRVVAPPEATGDLLTHEGFVDLIDHIRRAEERKGLRAPDEMKDEDA